MTLLSFDGRSSDTRDRGAVITGATLAEVWPEVSARLGRLLASRGASRDVADDVVQEVAARALARGIVFDDAADLMRWAVPVALNLLVDSARHAGRVTVGIDGIDGIDAAEADVADLVAHRDRLTRVLGAVSRLSDADRVALTSAETPADRREAVKLAVRRHRARRRLLALVDGVAAFVAWLAVCGRRVKAPRVASVAALPVAFVLPVALVLVQPVPGAPEQAITVVAPPRQPSLGAAEAPATRAVASVSAARTAPARRAAARPAAVKAVTAPARPPREVVKVGPKDKELIIRERPGTRNDHILCVHEPLPPFGEPPPCVL